MQDRIDYPPIQNGEEQPVTLLGRSAAITCFPEDYLYYWARWVVNNQQPASHAPLTRVLQEYPDPPSLFILALKVAWVVAYEPTGRHSYKTTAVIPAESGIFINPLL